MSTDHFR